MYMFDTMILCLTTTIKEGNLQRHFKTMHRKFEIDFLLKTKIREKTIRKKSSVKLINN